MQKFYATLLELLHKLHAEALAALEPLPPAALDWRPDPETNSLNVLVTHLLGAERFWVGNAVKDDTSHRNRDAEFQVSGLTYAALQQRFQDLEAYEQTALAGLTLETLDETRVLPDGREFSVAWSLGHALEHTALHVGHVEMLCQFWRQHQQRS